MASTEDTAKWSLGERIHLAEALARIEASLKNQDEHLEALVSTGSAVSSRLRDVEARAAATEGRVVMHEKVVGGISAAGAAVAAAWAFVVTYLRP